MKVYYALGALGSANWKIEDNGKSSYYALMADNYIKVYEQGKEIPGYLQTRVWTVAHPIHYYKLIKLILTGRVR